MLITAHSQMGYCSDGATYYNKWFYIKPERSSERKLKKENNNSEQTTVKTTHVKFFSLPIFVVFCITA